MTRKILVVLWLTCLMTLTTGVEAQSIQYSWTGLVEQMAPNPWALSGDGDTATQFDGTPFSIQAVVGTEVLSAGFNPNYARFPVDATLTIGGQVVTTANENLSLADDIFSGLFDSITFRAETTVLGVTRNFLANVRFDASSFSLPDLPQSTVPRLFPDQPQTQIGSAVGDGLITTPTADTIVTVTSIPEPSSLVALLSFSSLLVTRRRR